MTQELKYLKNFQYFSHMIQSPLQSSGILFCTPADEKDNSREKTQSFGVTSLNSWGTWGNIFEKKSNFFGKSKDIFQYEDSMKTLEKPPRIKRAPKLSIE